MNNNENTLYIISLPIGNMNDITLRAIEILQKVNIIYCEDTRQFEKYKYKYNINCKIDSYYDFNEKIKTVEIINLLKKNQNITIGLVSDCGTPMISDPGYHLIKAAYENNIKIIPIPGVSSVICGLSICPFNMSDFRFIGFFNDKYLNTIKNANYTIIFFESPKRIDKTLNKLKTYININRKIFIGREMTKTYETYYLFNMDNIPKIEELGEFVIIIEGNTFEEDNIINNLNLSNINKYNISIKSLALIISDVLNIKKKQIYNKLLENQ